ncbi:hypothetical protein BDB00DRAFT_346997 [Zychaea mexicana]|uniref:uncharacterized protein n=1 Tax=Zychaea mexicana TaxID=64656 RepID=UPI0022FEB099|nr:uncharacterized protein BDB00DRAFT_346997 [Zychaea mexicana]KAI9466417.1 hypothetical protein BDB00DRAFT_346997 [Zychaea mexicana]
MGKISVTISKIKCFNTTNSLVSLFCSTSIFMYQLHVCSSITEAASKNDTSTQQPSSSSSSSASASASDSTAAPVTSISSGPNQVPSMTSQKPRTAQHDGVQKLRNIIAQKYRQAIFENYQVALPEGRKMAWQDKAMYRDIVMSGWPEGTERVNPSRLLQHERDEIERRLNSGPLELLYTCIAGRTLVGV